MYDNLRAEKLLGDNPAIEKAVEFVTQEDNRSFPNEEKYYKDSPYTLLGLGRRANFEKLVQFFKDGLSPLQKLTDEQLEKYGLKQASERQKATVEKTESQWNELVDNGFVINSPKYGRILVDINGKFNSEAGGFTGAKAMGAGAYVLWSPKTRSFFFIHHRRTFSGKYASTRFP